MPLTAALGVVPLRVPPFGVVPMARATVAMPLASVKLVGLAKLPPVPVLLQVTVLPAVLTALPLASANWAEIVTLLPATGLLLLAVTRYFAAGPTTVVMLP